MAACDANYCFTFVDIGSFGRNSDGGVFSNSAFGKVLEAGTLQLPEPERISNNFTLPFVCVADEAFPLKTYLMRPYARRALQYTAEDTAEEFANKCKRKFFNYRLSRARRVIENSFGILAARWRIFRGPIKAKPENVVKYIKGSTV